MHARQPITTNLRDLLLAQEGVVSRVQCELTGFGIASADRLIRIGQWHVVAPGVYYTLPTELSWHARAWVGLLAGGDQAVLHLRSAGWLLTLVKTAPSEIEVLVPPGVKRSLEGYRFTRTTAMPRSRGLLSHTLAPRTVIDLCDDDPSCAVDLITRATAQRLVTRPQLRAELASRRQIRGRELLTDLLDDNLAGLESVLEVRFTREVLLAHGLPTGQRQVRSTGVRGRIDLVFEGKFIIELDGYLGHDGTDRFKDMWRDNEHTADGVPSMRFGWRDVTTLTCEAARLTERGMRRNGVDTSDAHPCPNCAGGDLWAA